ncbi:MAG TPA: hypothetical protein VGQ95_03955 [Chthoniobacterales bacterium]|nr:hypothetical protein [Chthoniobacterales bacterium]
MKKLTLTFCALFAFVSALYAGNEKYSGKEKEVMQPAPPVCELYRAHEWDLDFWGTFVFSANPGRFHVGDNDPFFPDADPVGEDNVIPDTDADGQPENLNPNEHINLGRQSKDEFLGKDNAFGGGIDLKYFWSRYFGAGVEGFDVNAHENGGGTLGTLTVRYPWGRFAPYAWGGAGALFGGGALYHFFNEKQDFGGGFVIGNNLGKESFNDVVVPNRHVRFLGQLGVGLEFRVTCHIGLMADLAWNFVGGVHDSQDRFLTVISPGGGAENAPASTAINLRPGTGSDNQDFGMARFGVTFSY